MFTIYRMAFVPTPKAIRYIVWTAMAQNWNKSFTHIEPQACAWAVGREGCCELNPSLHSIYFRLSGLQPSLLLIHLYCSDTCSHCTIVRHRTYAIWNAPFSRSARHIFLRCNRNRTEITPFVCVNGSPIRYQQYGFRDGARASILYSVSIYSLKKY